VVPIIGERLSVLMGGAGIPAAALFAAGASLAVLLCAVALRTLDRSVLPFGYAAVAIAVSGVAVHGGATVWPPGAYERYFLVWAVLVTVMIALGAAQRRPAALILGFALAIGVVADFRLPAPPDLGWERSNACIGAPSPCVVPVWPREYDIHWPGAGGSYEMPEHVDP
jgi:hypothetical protein